MTRDDVRVNGIAEHGEATFEIDLPECLSKLVLGTFRNVVDEDVKPALLAANFCDKALDLAGIQMVDNHGYTFSAASSDELGGFFDGFGPSRIVVCWQCLFEFVLGQSLRRFDGSRSAPRAVHRRACFPKGQSNPPPDSSRRAGNQRDALAQVRWPIRMRFGHTSSPNNYDFGVCGGRERR